MVGDLRGKWRHPGYARTQLVAMIGVLVAATRCVCEVIGLYLTTETTEARFSSVIYLSNATGADAGVGDRCS